MSGEHKIEDFKHIIKLTFLDGTAYYNPQALVGDPYLAARFLKPESTDKDIAYLRRSVDDEVKIEVVLLEDERKLYKDEYDYD